MATAADVTKPDAQAAPRSAEPQFEVARDAVQKEARFYDDAGAVIEHIGATKQKLLEQEREFETLFEYYIRNRGHLDITGAGAPGARPNLGTDDASWYYLDERGNKIWVRNITLDVAKASSYGGAGTTRTGAFEEGTHSDGRHVVVKVPKMKRHYALPADYRRRCEEAAAATEMRHSTVRRTLRESYSGVAAVDCWSDVPAPTNHTDAYIDAQRRLATSLKNGAGTVYRPPATIDEAEARLAQLRAEEQKLWEQLRQ